MKSHGLPGSAGMNWTEEDKVADPQGWTKQQQSELERSHGWAGGDAFKYGAGYYRGDECGFRRVGKNVQVHCQAIIPHAENIEVGDNVRIDAFTILSANEIIIGSFVHIASGCLMSGRGRIEFKDFSAMSHGAKIFTSADDLSVPALTNTTVPIELQALLTAPVTIDKHAIIGAGAIVMPGVTLGTGSVVAALSYVKEVVRPWSIVGGIPARLIKERAKHISSESLAELERRAWGR